MFQPSYDLSQFREGDVRSIMRLPASVIWTSILGIMTGIAAHRAARCIHPLQPAHNALRLPATAFLGTYSTMSIAGGIDWRHLTQKNCPGPLGRFAALRRFSSHDRNSLPRMIVGRTLSMTGRPDLIQFRIECLCTPSVRAASTTE
jgi:hypothetical protein